MIEPASLAQLDNLPTLPSSVTQLYALLDDDLAGAGEFERIIKPDPALTTNLLRLANSALFGCPRSMLSEALERMRLAMG